MKYRRKNIIVEAIQWFKLGDHPDVYIRAPGTLDVHCFTCGKLLNKCHGALKGNEKRICPGSWIITDPSGKVSSLSNKFFRQEYEAVT